MYLKWKYTVVVRQLVFQYFFNIVQMNELVTPQKHTVHGNLIYFGKVCKHGEK